MLILLHDNAKSQVAKATQKYLERVNWEILPQSPYSPDIASSDFHLFRFMQPVPSGERFSSYEYIKKWLDKQIISKEPDFFLRGIRLLSEWWEKVFAFNGAYFVIFCLNKHLC